MEILSCDWSASKFLIFSENVFDPLIYYSHFLPLISALVIGFFVFLNNRKNPTNLNFFLLAFFFSLWIYFDLILWAEARTDLVIFFWSILVFAELLMFYYTLSLFYSFTQKRDIPAFVKASFLLFSLPILLFAHTKLNLTYYDYSNCDRGAGEGVLWTYIYGLEIGVFLWIIRLTIKNYFSKELKQDKVQNLIFSGGLIFFVAIFISGNITLLLELPWEYEQYKLFGIIIFFLLMVFLMVRFKALNIKLVGTQALVWVMLILITSQFFFITSDLNRILNLLTVLFVGFSGYLLTRSVKKEIFLRESLQNANEEQENLIHFISHQVKGFFTKSRNIFSTIHDVKETIPQNLAPLVEEGLRSDKEGVQLVENILNAANLKTGKVTYSKEEFSLNQIIEEAVKENEIAAKKKDLKLNYHPAEGDDVKLIGDLARIKDVFMNLVQNSINYTFKGGVNVYVKKHPEKVEVIVKDTGVGLTPKDKENLFESGGRGEESLKYNVNSTGYGLFIAKKVIEEHAGKISADSAGRDKGSTFTVILPIK